MTMVEVNPTPRAGLEILQDIGNEEPKRKVMRVSLPDLARVSDVLAIAEALLQEAPTTATREFLLVGQLSPLTDSFFDEDPPLVGQPSTEKMRWRTDLTDNTGSCNVRVWDKPCYELFQTTAEGLRAKWEEGVDDEGKRQGILQQLNRNLTEDVRCVCRVAIWTFGAQSMQHEVQINVNLIDDSAK